MSTDTDPGASTTSEGDADPVEIELKFRVLDPAARSRVLAAERIGPFVADPRTRIVDTDDRFLDTPDRALAAARHAVRLRTTASGTVVTVKGPTTIGAGGAAQRMELEGAAHGTDPSAWATSAAADRVRGIAGSRSLEQVAALRQHRVTRILRAPDARAELSVDDVAILDGDDTVERFSEIELELLDGNAARLADAAAVLAADPGLRAATESKYAAALRALRGRHVTAPGGEPTEEAAATGIDATAREADGEAASPGEVSQRPPAVAHAAPPDDVDTADRRGDEPAGDDEAAGAGGDEPAGDDDGSDSLEAEPRRRSSSGRIDAGDVPIAELVRSILLVQLSRVAEREEGTRSGADPEDLHKMRVATRRMRAAWRVFRDALPDHGTRRIERELRRTAKLLGGVRDLDVLIEGLERYVASRPAAEATALRPLVADWEARRRMARAALVARLDDHDERRWRMDLTDLLDRGGPDVHALPGPRVRDVAGSRAWAALEAVRAYEPMLRWADVETLHALRIAGKRLRYTL